NNVNIGAITVGDAEADEQAEKFAAAVNRVAAQTGVMASVKGGVVTLTAKDGRNIDIDMSADNVGGVQSGTRRGSVVLRSTESIDIKADQSVLQALGLNVGQETKSYNSVNVLTAEQADIVLFVVDEALRVVNGTRADLGAVQNRFESV